MRAKLRAKLSSGSRGVPTEQLSPRTRENSGGDFLPFLSLSLLLAQGNYITSCNLRVINISLVVRLPVVHRSSTARSLPERHVLAPPGHGTFHDINADLIMRAMRSRAIFPLAADDRSCTRDVRVTRLPMIRECTVVAMSASSGRGGGGYLDQTTRHSCISDRSD